MVDVMGHLAMAMLWAAPAWLVWESRASLLFVGTALLTAMLPDADLVLRSFLPVHHHGVTHTVLFVTVVALVAGVLVAWIDRRLAEGDAESRTQLAATSPFTFAVAALLVGGYSHLFADMLSAPDIASPIEPFWPFFDKPWSVDVLWYNSPYWNVGLLTVAILLNLGLAWYAHRDSEGGSSTAHRTD